MPKNIGTPYIVYLVILLVLLTLIGKSTNRELGNEGVKYWETKIQEVKNPAIEVPIFDSSENQNGTKLMFNEINTDSFYYFKVTQDVYLDTVKKVLLSEVKYLDVCKNVVTDFGLYLGIGEYFRIYFVKPSLYKKPKTNRYFND